MDIQTAKQIRLEEYLHSLGYSPVKRQGINLWYKSPFREETEASFKVNTERTHRGTGTARASRFFLFSQAVLYRAEFPTVGNRATFFSCLARLLAGKGDKSGTVEKRMQGGTVYAQRQTVLRHCVSEHIGRL